MRIYFWLSPPTSQAARYKPNMIAVAEGLQDLGHEVVANINYWKETSNGGWLFKRSRPTYREALFVTGLDAWLFNGRDVMPMMMEFKRRSIPVVLFDWIASRFYSVPRERIELVDRYYFYSWNTRQSKCLLAQSWPIGLTERVIEATDIPETKRLRKVLWTHRVGHSLRAQVKRTFYDQHLSDFLVEWNDGFKLEEGTAYDRLMAHQTGKRHNPMFYEKLSQHRFVDCCGGKLVSPSIVQQHDSYKLWEAFAAGAVVICVDFEYYGIHFGDSSTPQPKSYVHYVGIRLGEENSLREAANWIRNASEETLCKVAATGREWAIKWFSPRPMATRLLEENVHLHTHSNESGFPRGAGDDGIGDRSSLQRSTTPASNSRGLE